MTRFWLRHPRLHNLAHRIAHARTPADKWCRMCRAVWYYLETLPDFNEGMREAEADFAAGRFEPFEHKVPRP
jgi:hypothetical protein